MAKAIVDIGVACSAHQIPSWWAAVMGMLLYTDRTKHLEVGKIRTSSGALPDSNKNSAIGQIKKRWNLTDVNRNQIINTGFLNGEAEWIFWIDDDTVPPVNAIEQLVGAGREFIAGLYFLPDKPYNPIAYKRTRNNLYEPLYGFPKGSMVQVDSVGMGCTLVHKSVYQKIKDGFSVVVRNNGSVFPVLKSQIMKPVYTQHKKEVDPYVRAGVYHEQVVPQTEEDDRNFPFYLLEHGRTEDHFFCELAEKVGVKPYVDTTVTCAHWKHQATTVEHYDNEIEQAEGIMQ